MIAAASVAALMVSPAAFAQGQFGTADEAKAMLLKAAAALKADKPKTLDLINKGEGGFLDRDINLDLQQGHKRAGVQRWECGRDYADHGPEGLRLVSSQEIDCGADGARDEAPSARSRSPGPVYERLHLLQGKLAIFIAVHCPENPFVSCLKLLQ